MTDAVAAARPRLLGTGFVSLAILALIAVRLVAAGLVDPGADEAYYFLWSRHVSWGYYDHPPMVAWWIAAGTALLGDGPFGIRIFFVLSAVPTTLAVWLTAKDLFDRETAMLAALWINATLLVGVGGISATPDAPAVMFWALTIWAFAAVVTTGRGAWWLAVGLFAGLGVLSKLTNLFVGLGLLLCLATRRDLRPWLASPQLWAGGAVAAAVVAPMVWWNFDHGWLTFTSQFTRLSPGGFNPLRFPELIATQFALLNPLAALFVGLAAVVWLRGRPGYPVRNIGLLIWTVLPLAAYMAWHSLHAQVQAHWLAPVFPALVVAGAAAAMAPPAERWRGLRILAFPVGVALSLIGLVLAANPGGVLPPRLDPGQMNHGWDGVAGEIERLRRETGADWIATTNYAVDAAIAYNLRGSGTPIVPIVDRKRYVFAPPPDAALLDRPALVLVREGRTDRLNGCFNRLEPAGTVERKSGDSTLERLAAFHATGPRPDLFIAGCW